MQGQSLPSRVLATFTSRTSKEHVLFEGLYWIGSQNTPLFQRRTLAHRSVG
jgi:hypothetical protein